MKDEKQLSVDEIINIVKKESLSLNTDINEKEIIFNQKSDINKSKLYLFLKKFVPLFRRLGLSNFVEIIKKTMNNKSTSSSYYSIDEFCKYNDEKFISNVYRKILNRDVDSDGLKLYSVMLREGVSKTQILSYIAFSKEAKNFNVKIKGLFIRYLLFKFFRIPIIGFLLEGIISIFRLPRLIKRINSFENSYIKDRTYFQDELSILNNKSEENSFNLENLEIKLKDLNIDNNRIHENLHNLINDYKNDFNSLQYIEKQLTLIEQNIINLLDNSKEKLTINTGQEIKKHLDKSNFDRFYLSFEDKFRGTREETLSKLEIYSPYIEELKRTNNDINALDIGCGRGEWLEYLNQNNLKGIGIDINEMMISISSDLGFDVYEMDALKYLKSCEDNSVDLITGFHIIEHIDFEILMDIFKESYRVLKKNGMVIFETPNPRNILVGSSDFYIDPTHKNPIHPLTLKFMINFNGFKESETMIIDEEKKLHNFESLEFNDISNYVNVGRDLVIIGKKN